jgi:hypothetical protein
MNSSLSHAIQYCRFLISDHGSISDHIFLGTCSYFATGEGMTQTFFVFYNPSIGINDKEAIYEAANNFICDHLGKYSYFCQYPDLIMNYSEFCLPTSEDSSSEVSRIKYYMPRVCESITNNIAKNGAGNFNHIQVTHANFS